MMTESQITVGELTSFLLYAAYVGISIAGESWCLCVRVCACVCPCGPVYMHVY